ncbi:MAG: recombinase family protein [Novosphingobium sp.]|nr:recombinase family protein [Novosphingobium sp.]
MKVLRCAVYTRKSTEDGLEQEFNSLDAQREACEAYILSQRHEDWTLVPGRYDDGGFSGGNMERPGIKALLAEVDAGNVDVIVVYKVDRLTRSLADFAKIVERLDLLALVADAMAAQRLVLASPELSLTQLAKREGRCRTQLARLLRLSWLSPRIIEAIAEGSQPKGLTRRGLLIGILPIDWTEQERQFGFAI